MNKEKESAMEELKKLGKELGIKGYHNMKKETLVARIEEAGGVIDFDKVDEAEEVAEVAEVEVAKEEPVRRVAPRIQVISKRQSGRQKLLEECRVSDPECEFFMQPAGITDAQLAAKGLERTDKSLGNEVVCRTNKQSFVEYQEQSNQAALDSMNAVDDKGRLVKALDAQVKKPVN